MKFLSTPILLGILSGNAQSRCNLINSPLFAKEAELNVKFEGEHHTDIRDDGTRNLVKISVGNEVLSLINIQGMNVKT